MDRSFFLRKLHQLTGVLPIGAYMAVHLWINDHALAGAASFDTTINQLESMPFLVAVEWLLIYLPLIFHSFYGVYIALQARHNVGRYPYARNYRFLLQRLTGFFLLAFLAFHVATLHYGLDPHSWVWEGKNLSFAGIADHLGRPDTMGQGAVWWVGAFTMLGLLAATFHFANGLWEFMIDWGITVGPKAQRVGTAIAVAVFIVLTGMGVSALYAFFKLPLTGGPVATGLAGANRVALLSTGGSAPPVPRSGFASTQKGR